MTHSHDHSTGKSVDSKELKGSPPLFFFVGTVPCVHTKETQIENWVWLRLCHQSLFHLQVPDLGGNLYRRHSWLELGALEKSKAVAQ